MRELKFRAWHKETENVKAHMAYSENDLERFFRLYDGWDMMQFTGLKDCKGRDIYEGDILCWTPNWGDTTPFIGVVEWFLHGFKIMRLPTRDRWDNLNHDWKIIGNIYEGLHSGVIIPVYFNIYESKELLDKEER